MPLCQMGGREFGDQQHLVTEVPIRTFWKGYCDLMGMEVAAMSYVDPERVVELNYRYAECLDSNRLAEWPEFFTEDCRYLIHPRENLDAGLEGYWLYFENRRMLRDRVVSLLEVNIYQIHYERRFVSNVMLTGRDGRRLARAGELHARCTTDSEGHSKIFSVGRVPRPRGRDRRPSCASASAR